MNPNIIHKQVEAVEETPMDIKDIISDLKEYGGEENSTENEELYNEVIENILPLLEKIDGEENDFHNENICEG